MPLNKQKVREAFILLLFLLTFEKGEVTQKLNNYLDYCIPDIEQLGQKPKQNPKHTVTLNKEKVREAFILLHFLLTFEKGEVTQKLNFVYHIVYLTWNNWDKNKNKTKPKTSGRVSFIYFFYFYFFFCSFVFGQSKPFL